MVVLFVSEIIGQKDSQLEKFSAENTSRHNTKLYSHIKIKSKVKGEVRVMKYYSCCSLGAPGGLEVFIIKKMKQE